MKAIVKSTNKPVTVEQVPVNIDEMTSYFVYIDRETNKQYKYNELKFE